MTSLIRARGSLEEISTLFAAKPNGDLVWRPWTWPGEAALVVTQSGDGARWLQSMLWGLPETAFPSAPSLASRGVFYSRDMMPRGGRIASPGNLQRCLIVMEACAYPAGETTRRTRAWAGLWDEPLCAWAGLCSVEGAGGWAGLLMPANSLLERVTSNMPALLDLADQALWLEGASPLALSLNYSQEAWYLEPSDEVWATGVPMDEA